MKREKEEERRYKGIDIPFESFWTANWKKKREERRIGARAAEVFDSFVGRRSKQKEGLIPGECKISRRRRRKKGKEKGKRKEHFPDSRTQKEFIQQLHGKWPFYSAFSACLLFPNGWRRIIYLWINGEIYQWFRKWKATASGVRLKNFLLSLIFCIERILSRFLNIFLFLLFSNLASHLYPQGVHRILLLLLYSSSSSDQGNSSPIHPREKRKRKRRLLHLIDNVLFHPK